MKTVITLNEQGQEHCTRHGDKPCDCLFEMLVRSALKVNPTLDAVRRRLDATR